MEDARIRRELRWLKIYALVTSVALTALTLSAFRRAREKFDEIDVQRINIVEPDGAYRMILSNRAMSPGPIYKGQPFGYPGGSRPGIIFFNDEGTENGGLVFSGQRDSSGAVEASAHMSFDQYNQDQVLNLDYAEGRGRRLVGISMLDRAPVDIKELVDRLDSIRAIPDTVARSAAMQALMTTPGGEPLQAMRVFLGRGRNRAALLSLSDPQGHERLRIAVDSMGVPSLEFLDPTGRVTTRLP